MPNYSLGLDLGQQRDYSALVVTERVHRHVPGPTAENSFGDPRGDAAWEDAYQVRHVQR